ncbi:predicted protein [Streptomyces viridosporus ATCC 14672]|uniref:Predicted protein n=1 Tax=Streptomyces viridosporus (strain ATCC 14672 / DSM 40746 / JCM 4963 / KCTC 9882 / NRRL B-12104 / FH 1290) TaxID=566461 RepID=D5ZYU3_STRV1|nr:predicted protein [Streptomyces viridosporus ATCC 14672]
MDARAVRPDGTTAEDVPSICSVPPMDTSSGLVHNA